MHIHGTCTLVLFIYLVRGLGVRISAHPSHHDIGVNKYRSTLGILRILAKQVHLLINDNDHMLDSYLYYNIIVLSICHDGGGGLQTRDRTYWCPTVYITA